MAEVSCQTSHSVYWDTRTCQGKNAKSFEHDPVNTLWETAMDPWYSHHFIPK